jgi:hypothetical protein
MVLIEVVFMNTLPLAEVDFFKSKNYQLAIVFTSPSHFSQQCKAKR